MNKGKYEAECAGARKAAEGAVALLIIIDGKNGSGFSMEIDARRTGLEWIAEVPILLRDVAASIEKQLQTGPIEAHWRESKEN